MKNLKKLLLLAVMFVNIMPYLKDGKVELSTTQAEAQLYYTESTDGYFWLCGEIAHKYDASYFFTSDKVCEGLAEKPVVVPSSGFDTEYSPLSSNPCATSIPTSTYKNDGVGMPITYDCIFMVAEALTNATAKDESLAHPSGISDPANSQGVSSNLNTINYLKSLGLTVTKISNSESGLISAMSNCNNKVIVTSCDLESEVNNIFIGHILIIYGIAKINKKFEALTWDSNIKTHMDGSFYVMGGQSPVSIANLISGKNLYIVK